MNLPIRNVSLIALALAVTAILIIRLAGSNDLAAPTKFNPPANPVANVTDEQHDDDARTELSTRHDKPQPSGEPTGVVTVTVRSESKAPLAGCLVSLGDGIVAKSDADGRASFELPPQRVWLDVKPPTETNLQHFQSRLTISRGLHKQIEVVLIANIAQQWCRLIDAETKRALAGAEVVIHPRDHLVITTDEQGIAKLLLQPGDAFASAAANGYADRSIAIVPGHESSATALDVPLEASASIDITCVDGEDHPVAEVFVTARALVSDLLWPRGSENLGTTQCWSGRSDSTGKIALVGLPARTTVYLQYSTPSTAAAPPATSLELKRGSNPLRIALSGAGTISGRVLDAAGAPVIGARVTCLANSNTESPALFPEQAIQGESTITDGHGDYELTPLRGGMWLVGLHLSEGWTSQCFRVDLPPGGAAQLNIRADRALAIEGRLVGPDGLPMSAFTVHAERSGILMATAVTDHSGTFRLAPLLAGQYDVATEFYDQQLALPQALQVAAGTIGVMLRVMPVIGSITGTVESDLPSGGSVWLSGLRRSGDESIEVLCDADGGFAISNLRSGTWDFHAHDTHGQVALRSGIVIEAGRSVVALELELIRGGNVRLLHPEADTCMIRRGVAAVAKQPIEGGLPAEALVPPGKSTAVFLRGGIELLRIPFTIRAGENLTISPPR